MDDNVKRRPYAAAGRREQSHATRQRIIDAARQLIVGTGYRAMTVAAVARSAGVHVDTVYQLVGRKPQLVLELIEQALSGTDHAVAGEAREHIVAMRRATDPVEKLAIYAAAVRETHGRLAPLFVALRDASATDAEARTVLRDVSSRRAANMRKLVADLADTGRLRSDLSIDEGADVVWVTNSPEMYLMLTVERNWSAQRYQTWLADAWCRLLLEPGDGHGDGRDETHGSAHGETDGHGQAHGNAHGETDGRDKAHGKQDGKRNGEADGRPR